MVSKSNISSPSHSNPWWALYIRLSREDGDKAESLSVAHQKMKLIEYIQKIPDATDFELYIDDGWTGTNFDRPDFQRLLQDIRKQHIIGIIVKDLSRLGRDNSKTNYYIHEFFPAHKIRFIAIDDTIDKNYYDCNTSSDMMIDVKNMLNGFYPRDISNKVRSTFRTKQQAGQFIGAFACYGYRKSPDDHNTLLIDEPAAAVVRQIYAMYLGGIGQNTIAKILNDREIPCPSAYKKLQGLNYHNSKRLDHTTYWTYSSIRNILRNEIYTGVMVQNKSFRQVCKKKAITLPRDQWIVVPDTHASIIDKETFRKVQNLLTQNTRQTNLKQNMHPFAGLLKCGDCGRAMCKIKRRGITTFSCGSYNRYGTSKCSSHYIPETVLANIILNDFNAILADLPDLKDLVLDEEKKHHSPDSQNTDEIKTLQHEIAKLVQKKDQAYEDYSENVISRADYIRYRKRYEEQITILEQHIQTLTDSDTDTAPSASDTWISQLVKNQHLREINRILVVEMVRQIEIYQNNTIKILYNFSALAG